MNTVVSVLLLIVCSSFKNTSEYVIANYLLENLYHICDISRANVCEDTGISNRTLIAFCVTLGFKNYSDLKLTIIKTIDVRKLQMKVHINNMNVKSLLVAMNALSTVDFDEVKFEKTVESINTYIHDSNKVIIVGAVYPEMLCLHYMEDMLMLGKYISSSPVNTSLRPVENDTLVLMISFTGRVYIEHYDEIIKFKENNISVIGIGNPHSVPDQIHLNKFLELPFEADTETENACIPLVLQYMKLRYFEMYGDDRNVNL